MNDAGSIQITTWHVLLGASAVIAFLWAGVVYFAKQDRDGISKAIGAARAEAHRNHASIDAEVREIKGDVNEIKVRMGRFVTREQIDHDFERLLHEQNNRYAELRGFLTAWLERMERSIAAKADKA